MATYRFSRPLLALFICFAVALPAGLSDFFERFKGKSSSGTGDAVSALTQSEAADGLRAALKKGVESAINSLGQTDGFLGNPEVKIPVPEKLGFVEKGLRAVGKESLADDFVLSMNRAAEAAVPIAADVFSSAISQMTVDDAVSIVDGPNTAATDYLKKSSSGDLRERFKPIVEQAMQQVGVTKKYQDVMGAGGSVGKFFGSKNDFDLSNYVTDKALDGVFFMVAGEDNGSAKTRPRGRPIC